VLAAENRLRDSDAFRRTVKSGRRAGSRAVVVHLLEPTAGTTSPAPPRAGFVVSKAVGNAVVRTRVKRRLRHLVRSRLAPLAPGSELVVRALPAAAALGSTELGTELDRCLSRARRTSAAGREGTVSAT
jgi:ribonuclease P protein component